MKPLLLLDVDGVLNPFPECPDGFEGHDFFPEDDEPVRLARVHGEWLRELGGAFEVVWATGWGDEANSVLCPFFGLPEYAVVPMPPIPFGPEEKVPAVAEYAGERPAAWVDDSIGEHARDWARSRLSPTLLVSVDPARGLARDHVDELVVWAGGLGVIRA